MDHNISEMDSIKAEQTRVDETSQWNRHTTLYLQSQGLFIYETIVQNVTHRHIGPLRILQL